MVIGVTGQIGSGKSTAAAILGALGAVVIDADRIGREVVDKNPQLRQRLADEFGDDVLTSEGNLRRKRLAAKAFANAEAKAKLNELVHPYLLDELRQRVNQWEARGRVVVIDAALLLDWKLDYEIDYTLVIHAGLDTRLSRLAERGISRADTLARQQAQLPFTEYRRRADRVILNRGSIDDLRRKLSEWWRQTVQNRSKNG
jgi:dephospho-CoA kinase